MQSKLATLILGILSEQERNPYDITKMLKELNTKKFLPIADSTIYATINNLKGKNLIEGRAERTGNLPEKTIYKITVEGEYELHESINSFLDEDNSSPSNFDIGILLMYNLSRKEVLLKLKKKLERLEANYYETRKQIINLERGNQPIAFTSLAMLKHKLHLTEAEIKTVKELIKELNVNYQTAELTPFDMRMI